MKAQISYPNFQISGSRFEIRWLAHVLVAAALLLSPAVSSARQKKPKKAIKDGDAQKVIAATPGFVLNKGVVRVRDTSLAGAVPVVVKAEVELAVHFERVGTKESGERWRAIEFRSGDRAWEEFDYLAGPVGDGQIEAARAALEEMAAEFETRLRERKALEDAAKPEARVENTDDEKQDKRKKTKEEKRREKEEKKRAEEAKKLAEEARKIEVRRGPLLMKDFSPMYKSARGVVMVEADFQLDKDARGKWQVNGFRLGETAFTDLARLLAAIDAAKATRARADLERVRAALEAFRRERGFYVVAEDGVALIDHLSPRHLLQVIRVDPWHRPYRYTGTREHFTFSSDGPDGKPSTPDDVSISEVSSKR